MPPTSAFIDVEQVSKRYRNQRVLSNVTLRLGPRQKGALVGSNGVGKSTLLRLIAGVERPNAGSVNMPSGALVGYLPQEVPVRGEESVDGYLRRVTGIDEVHRRMDELAADLGTGGRMDAYAETHTQFECLGGYDFERRVRIVLAGFGLRDVDAARSLQSLSGGQRSKVALGGILLKGVDVLLLDEPTNNLDLPALLWLENFLIQSTATILLVSHDRRLIDRVASKVFEIDWHTREATTYGGGYSDFLELKSQELRRQKELFRRQQEEIVRLSDSVRQNKQWAEMGAVQQGSDHDKMGRDFSRERSAGLAKRSKSIEKRLDQMELVDQPAERQPLELHLAPAGQQQATDASLDAQNDKRGELIRLEGVRIGYPRGFSLGPIDLAAEAGMRVGILGPNGSGKSTLLKVLTGQLEPLVGTVSIGKGLIFGNLMQAHENLPRATTPLWFLQTQTDLDEGGALELLRSFQLHPLDVGKPIHDVSPGVRTRLLLAYFSTIRANVLVLDEPTNNLDLEAIQALEEALVSYAGMALIVSHDRQFLDHVALSHCFLLQDGHFERIPSFASYVADVDVRAKKLLTRL
ncbi:MAG: ABC-F family ATP-binding cassette domain-containing protein [Chloroflexota bacterium]